MAVWKGIQTRIVGIIRQVLYPYCFSSNSISVKSSRDIRCPLSLCYPCLFTLLYYHPHFPILFYSALFIYGPATPIIHARYAFDKKNDTVGTVRCIRLEIDSNKIMLCKVCTYVVLFVNCWLHKRLYELNNYLATKKHWVFPQELLEMWNKSPEETICGEVCYSHPSILTWLFHREQLHPFFFLKILLSRLYHEVDG